MTSRLRFSKCYIGNKVLVLCGNKFMLDSSCKGLTKPQPHFSLLNAGKELSKIVLQEMKIQTFQKKIKHTTLHTYYLPTVTP